MQKLIVLCIFYMMAQAGNAQSTGDFRSSASGNWNTSTNWQRYSSGSVWESSGTGENNPGLTPTSSNNVYVQSGHTITLQKNEACNDLHIANSTTSSIGTYGLLTISTYTLSINGKIRCYYAAVGTIPGTSATNGYSVYPFSCSTGKVSIVGNTRNLTAVGEWSANISTASTNTFTLEFNLNSNQTATINTSLKATSFNVVAGTLAAGSNIISADDGIVGEGDITIGASGTISSSQSAAANNVFQRTTTTRAGTLTVNGNLSLSGTSPYVQMNAVVINGTVTFTKSGSQSFINGQNSGAVPATYTNITTSGSGTKTLIGNTSVSGTITIGDGTTLALSTFTCTLLSTSTATAKVAQIGTGTITYGSGGQFAVQRYIKTNSYANRKFWFLSAPPLTSGSSKTVANSWQTKIQITGAGTGGTVCSSNTTIDASTTNSNGFDASGNNINTVLYYDDTKATNAKWTGITATTQTLKAGDGYRVLIRGDRTTQGCALLYTSPPTGSDVTLSAAGTLQTGTLAVTLTNSAASGYNLIGNPYPNEIDFSAFQTTNSGIVNQYWTYLPSNAAGTYSNYNAGTLTNFGTYINGAIIASGQSFFIQNGGSTVSTVTFNEAHKSSTTQYGLFGGNENLWKEKLRISLFNNTNNLIDEVVVRFGNQIKDSKIYDLNWDSKSLNEGTQYIQTVKAENRLAIQTRNKNFITDTVLLNIKSGNATLNLHFTEFEESKFADIYLIDKYNNTTQKINDNPDYAFTVNSNDSASFGAKRFIVVFHSTKIITTAIDNVDSSNATILIYPNPVTTALKITSKAIINTVRLINSAGAASITQNNINNTQTIINTTRLSPGLYMVEITDSSGMITIKKMMKQ